MPTAASCSEADVNSAIAAAATGDVVNIPAGDCTWTTGITYSKAIHLKGAGSTITGTMIRDNITGTGKIIDATCPEGQAPPSAPCRISGIYFADGGHVFNAAHILVEIQGSSEPNTFWRIDHNVFDHYQRGYGINVQTVVGVYDHNEVYSTGSQHGIGVNDDFWGGYDRGDGSWYLPFTFGSADSFFIEDNYFEWDVEGGAIDGFGGARMSWRFNLCVRCQVANHGTEGQRSRGSLGYEVYTSDFDDRDGAHLINSRGGTMFAFLNRARGMTGSKKVASLDLNRAYHWFPETNKFGGITGVYAGDNNSPSDPNNATGTVASFTPNGEGGTITVAGTPWTNAIWTPTVTSAYWVNKTSACTPSSTVRCAAKIESNTTNTLTFGQDLLATQVLSFSGGDTFEVTRVLEGIDQHGRIGGGLVSESVPVFPWTPGQNDQVDEPMGEWLNCDEDADTSNCTSHSLHYGSLSTSELYGICRPLEHYGDYSPSFDGTLNGTICIGAGTFAAIPATCTTGTKYWATDRGDWNGNTEATFSNGKPRHTGQGALYKCTSPNTWTLYYEPYPYPHPLTLDQPAGPLIHGSRLEGTVQGVS